MKKPISRLRPYYAIRWQCRINHTLPFSHKTVGRTGGMHEGEIYSKSTLIRDFLQLGAYVLTELAGNG